jgi:predicted ATPase/DNA-binding winged helix-turn-helix (wHTH) protein
MNHIAQMRANLMLSFEAMSDAAAYAKLKFGPFELSIGERLLRREGVVLPLGSRALDILIYLAERPGEVIAKQELIDHVWPDVTVEEGSLRVHVAAIRKALGDGQFGNRYIANIKGRGYSFVGTVVPLAGSTKSGNDKFRHQGRLAVQPILMIGRETVVSKVSDKLRDERFVTLLGPGGIGKTTIALAVGRAVAEEFGGNVYFADLESLTDSRHVAEAVATSLGLSLKSKDPGLELVDLVRSRKLLIILDSCEHVIETVALLAEQLYQETEQVYLLTTSRELLKVEGEHCCRVPPLDCPPDGSEQTANAVLRYPAVQLFIRRVAARAGSIVFSDEEAPLVAEICRKLDGIPLAIELAAGQAAALGIKSTVALLASRMGLLRLSHRTAVPRHRTLKATLDWSYDLLSDGERIVLRRISPFLGYFTLEGVRYVAGELGVGIGEIFDAIAGLVEKSLIATRIDETQAQYRMLNTTRAYALEKLEEHAEVGVVLRRHAEYVAEQLEPERTNLSDLPRAERLAIYSGQLSNVRAALEWSFGPRGDAEIATRLAVPATQLLLELSLLTECQLWSERAIALLGSQHPDSRREMGICATLPFALMYTEGNSQRVRAAFFRALDAAIRQRDLDYELRLLNGLFRYSYWTNDISSAVEFAARSKKVALKTQDPDNLALAESMLGAANLLTGNHPVAQKHFESSFGHTRSGSRFRAGLHLFDHVSFSLAGMARSLLYRGLLVKSLDYANRAIDEAKRAGRPGILCRALAMVFPVFLASGNAALSAQCVTQIADLASAYSLIPYRALATGQRGQLLLFQGTIEDGIPLLRQALKELHDQRYEMLNIDFICELSAGLMMTGDHEEALALIANALDVQQQAVKLLHMPNLLRMKGLVLASRSIEDHAEAEQSFLSSIDWARRQSATFFELKAATDLAELLLKQGRMAEADKHLSAAHDRTPAGIVSPAHKRALQIRNRLQSGTEAVG